MTNHHSKKNAPTHVCPRARREWTFPPKRLTELSFQFKVDRLQSQSHNRTGQTCNHHPLHGAQEEDEPAAQGHESRWAAHCCPHHHHPRAWVRNEEDLSLCDCAAGGGGPMVSPRTQWWRPHYGLHKQKYTGFKLEQVTDGETSYQQTAHP